MDKRGLTEREMYLMRWAYECGQVDGDDPPPWRDLEFHLGDVISDAGHKASEHLLYYAPPPALLTEADFHDTLIPNNVGMPGQPVNGPRHRENLAVIDADAYPVALFEFSRLMRVDVSFQDHEGPEGPCESFPVRVIIRRI